MKKIIIEPGCIGCGLCAYVASEVFELNSVSHVKKTADLERHSECIQQAIAGCPVGVIKMEENNEIQSK